MVFGHLQLRCWTADMLAFFICFQPLSYLARDRRAWSVALWAVKPKMLLKSITPHGYSRIYPDNLFFKASLLHRTSAVDGSTARTPCNLIRASGVKNTPPACVCSCTRRRRLNESLLKYRLLCHSTSPAGTRIDCIWLAARLGDNMRMSEWNQTDNKTKCARATPLHHTGAECEEWSTEGSPPSCPNDTGPLNNKRHCPMFHILLWVSSIKMF